MPTRSSSTAALRERLPERTGHRRDGNVLPSGQSGLQGMRHRDAFGPLRPDSVHPRRGRLQAQRGCGLPDPWAPAARQSAGIFSLLIHALVSGQGLREAAESALGELDGPPAQGEEPDAERLARLESALRLGPRENCWAPKNWSGSSARAGWRRRHSPSRSTRYWPRHRSRRRLPETRRPTSARPSPSP